MVVPRATYRLQLRPEFGFDDAAAVVPYLARLGISHVYCSPYLQAAPGSTHGYDVVDHSRVNEDLGGAAAHRRMCDAIRRAGMGQVLDIVPNHMAVVAGNRWWDDVLENGPASAFASYFDVDWDPPEQKLRSRVLMPVLGDHYGRVLEAGDLAIRRAGGSLGVGYFEHCLPLAPPTYEVVLGPAAARTGDDDLAFFARAFASLPPSSVTDRAASADRHRDKEVLKRRLGEHLERHPGLAAAVDEEIDRLNADVDRLDALLERQNFRLARWRTAGEELDYRRFFDITTLAGLRTEDPECFAATHRLVLDLVREGSVDGLRVDHPDGLRDPQQYVERLRAAAPDAWIVLEKILLPGEELPPWPADGTTGYDFLQLAQGVLLGGAAEASLLDAYRGFTGDDRSWEATAHEAKHEILDGTLAADVRRLTQLFVEVCEAERRHRDFTRSELRAALVETVACFGVYRTYVRPGEPVGDDDARTIARALAEAAERRGDLDGELFQLLGSVLRGEVPGPGAELCARFQQTTGPVMAKGVEDTAFYRYTPLLALDEVGGEPGRFGLEVDEFHRHLERADQRWPRAMLASSTHDTKRSEDVRARLLVLAELPEEVAATFGRWAAHNAGYGLDDRPMEWQLYQTLVGAHPLPCDRLLEFARKAAREAKRRTSWTHPDEAYEARLEAFCRGVSVDDTFQAELSALVEVVRDAGRVNSLSLQLLKLLGPGVPDIYQGTELWDLSLVDPDNRRAVDFRRRADLLDQLDGRTPEELLAGADDGLPKLALTRAALALRARCTLGPYRPLDAPTAVVAFARGEQAVAVVPRRPLRGEGEGSVELPPGRWRDEITREEHEGGPVALTRLLARFPVALLGTAGG